MHFGAVLGEISLNWRLFLLLKQYHNTLQFDQDFSLKIMYHASRGVGMGSFASPPLQRVTNIVFTFVLHERSVGLVALQPSLDEEKTSFP